MALRAFLARLGRHRLGRCAQHALERDIEVSHDRHPLDSALLDLVQALFHGCRVSVVNDVLEVPDHYRVDSLTQLRWVQAALALLHVAVVLDRGHDRGLGRGPADAALLQLVDQRCLGVAGWRLREVLLWLQTVEIQNLPFSQLRKLLFALVVALPDPVEAVERKHGAGRSQAERAGLDVDRCACVLRGRHPAGHEPAPDKLVDTELVLRQVLTDILRTPVGVGGPDRLMRVLGARPRLLLTRLAQVAIPQVALDPAVDLRLGFSRDPGRVGPHVRDQACRTITAQLDAFVQVLRQAHRLFRCVAETAGRVLLKRGGYVRRRRILAPPLLFDGYDAIFGAFQFADGGQSLGLGLELEFDVWLGQPAHEASFEPLLLALRRQDGVYRPGFLWREGPDLLFAVDDEAKRNRLHPSSTDPLLHLAPEEGTEPVADKAVDHPSRLLSVDQPHVDVPRVVQGAQYGVIRDLMELDPLGMAQAKD